MQVGLRQDPTTGLFRWVCKCGAGTGVRNSGDVNDRAPVAVLRPNQWQSEEDARRERLGHMIQHREKPNFTIVPTVKIVTKNPALGIAILAQAA